MKSLVCLCLEVDSGCHEQGTSQPIYINAMGNVNPFFLELCLSLSLYSRHDCMIEDIASVRNISYEGVWHDPGMIYKALDVI